MTTPSLKGQSDQLVFFKATKLLVEGGKYALLQLLVQATAKPGGKPYAGIYSMLERKKARVKSLQRHKAINNDQFEMLYPRDGSQTDIFKWDIALTASILKNFVSLDPTGMSVVTDLRKLRNEVLEYGHTGKPLSETDCRKLWSETTTVLKQAVKILNNPECRTRLSDMIVKVATEKIHSDVDINEQLDKILRSEREVRGMLSAVTSRINFVKENLKRKVGETDDAEIDLNALDEIGKAELQLREHESFVDHWKFPLKTKVSTVATDCLRDHNVVVLSGTPGSGKSYTARSVVLSMLRSGRNLIPIAKRDPEGIKHVLEGKKEAILLIDDIVGSFEINACELRAWNAFIDLFMARIESRKVFVVITVRKGILNLLRNENMKDLFNHKWTIDVDDETLPHEKQEMLYAYADEKRITIDDTHVLQVSKGSNRDIGFPLMCRLMINENILKHFSRSLKQVQHDLEVFMRREYTFFLVVVVTLFGENTISKTKLSKIQATVLRLVHDKFGGKVNQEAIGRTIEFISNTFLETGTDKTNYSLMHNVVLETVMKICLSEIPEILFKHCPLRMLLQFSYLFGEKTVKRHDDEEEEIVRDYADIHLFTMRILEEIQGKQAPMKDISCSAIWFKTPVLEDALTPAELKIFFLPDVKDNSLFTTFAGCGSLTILQFMAQKEEIRKFIEAQLNQAIIQAATNGHKSSVSLLISFATAVTDKMMFAAVKGGNVHVLELLRAYGGNMAAVDASGQSLLHTASIHGLFDIVEYICQTSIDLIYLSDNEGYSAVHFAAAGGNLRCLAYLVDEGLSPLSKTKDGLTILHIATLYDKPDAVIYICDTYPVLVDKKDNDRWNAAMFAAKSGSLVSLAYLNDKGIDMYIFSKKKGISALHISALSGHFGIVKFLCENFLGLLLIQDRDGLNAAHYAAIGGHVDSLKYLLMQGIDAAWQSDKGFTVLHFAVRENHSHIVKYLCNKSAIILNIRDEVGMNAAHHAAARSKDALEYLLEQGMHPHSITDEGQTLLHIAAAANKVDCVQYLCENFEEIIHVRDENQWKASHHAAFNGSAECLEMLFQFDKETMAVTEDGMTVFDLAKEQQQNRCVSAIIENQKLNKADFCIIT